VTGVLLAATAVTAATACGSSPSSSSSVPAASTASTSGAPAASGGGSVTNVTLGYVPYSDDASLFYAQDSGIFRKHGLNVTFVPQASPVAVEASMASGTEQFGFITIQDLKKLFLLSHKATRPHLRRRRSPRCRRQRPQNHPRAWLTTVTTLRQRRVARRFRLRF